MKKITKDGVIYYITPEPICTNWLHSDKQIFPYILKLEMEILCTFGIKPSIQKIEIQEWIYKLFDGKVISSVDNNTTEMIEFAKILTNSDSPIMFVERLDSDYIVQTLFNIIDKLLDENCKLLSLKYGH